MLQPIIVPDSVLSWLRDISEKAQMKDALSALPEQLDTPVGEGGDAFSVGACCRSLLELLPVPFYSVSQVQLECDKYSFC